LQESDPLVRYCPRAGCGGIVHAAN